MRSGVTACSLGDGCDTDNDNSDTNSDMSRFSRVRKPKKRTRSGVREQDKRTEGMNMTHQEIVERRRQQRVGSHESTISPGGSICSGSTGRSLGRDGDDTGDDNSDKNSVKSRFSRANSAGTLESQHTSTIIVNVAARRARDRALEEDRAREAKRFMDGRVREQAETGKDRDWEEDHHRTVKEIRRKLGLDLVPRCLDSIVSCGWSPFEFITECGGGTMRSGESPSEDPREPVPVGAGMSLFDPSYCGSQFTESGQVEPLRFDADADADVPTEWGFLTQPMTLASKHRGPGGYIVVSEMEPVSSVGQGGQEVGERSSRDGVTVAD